MKLGLPENNKQLEWDLYFMGIAKQVSKNSKCLSRKIGAIIVKDKVPISTGYNGPPRGVPHCDSDERICFIIDQLKFNDENLETDAAEIVSIKEFKGKSKYMCPRRVLGYKSGEGLHLCQAGHAERNAIVNAAREGIRVKGSTMYCWCPTPCSPCLIEIINAGIVRVVATKEYYYDEIAEWLIKTSDLEMCYLEE